MADIQDAKKDCSAVALQGTRACPTEGTWEHVTQALSEKKAAVVETALMGVADYSLNLTEDESMETSLVVGAAMTLPAAAAMGLVAYRLSRIEDTLGQKINSAELKSDNSVRAKQENMHQRITDLTLHQDITLYQTCKNIGIGMVQGGVCVGAGIDVLSDTKLLGLQKPEAKLGVVGSFKF